jgi:hypothetical protein
VYAGRVNVFGIAIMLMYQTIKTISFPVIIASSVLLAKQSLAVNLTATVQTDTLTKLVVSWTGKGGLDGENITLLAPTLTHWEVPQVLLNYVGGGNGWSGQVTARHITDPHPELGESGGGSQVTLPIAFSNVSPPPEGSPPNSGSSSDVVSHPPLHFDSYTLTWSFIPEVGNDQLTVTLKGVHTPEPTSTLSILSLGILGAGATLKRKVKRSHSTEKEPTNVG